MDEVKHQLRVLRESWVRCTRCALGEDRTERVVFGSGSPQPTYLFIYDVPTADDVATGTPMSGGAGTVMFDLLQNAEIEFKDAYCTPVLGCRPTVLLPATDDTPERIADRAPKKEEVAACKARIDALIYLLDPRLIFTLGEVSWKTMVKGKDRDGHTRLDKAVGNIVLTRIAGKVAPEVTYPVIPLLSMKQIEASPSVAKHGTLGVVTKHLTKGKAYVEYVRKLEEEDRNNSKTTNL